MKKRTEIRIQQYSVIILSTIVTIVAIAFFIGGYIMMWNMNKPLNVSQISRYEQIARDVYEQKKIELDPHDNLSISVTENAITIKSADNTYRGMIVAKFKNGELVITRNMETGSTVFMSLMTGLFFSACAYMAVLAIIVAIEAVQESIRIRKIANGER